MLPKFMRSFKVESQEENNKEQNKRRKQNSFDEMDFVGLRILPQITRSSSKNNKSNYVLVKSSITKRNNLTKPVEYCFLKTCNLCNKVLSPDKDIYMYRGDQGFCSEKCRNRQIVMDEMKEIENSTKQMVASYRKCCNEARQETRLILEDLRMQRLKSKV